MRNGYIGIYRKILDWRWFKFPYHLQTFIYLLEMANWKDTQYGRTELTRGQLITSLRAIKEDVGCSLDTIKKVLKDFEDTGEITKKSSPHGTLITIVNFNKYQASVLPRSTRTEHKATRKPNAEKDTDRTESGNQTEHGAEQEPNAEPYYIKNIKKDKKEKRNIKKEEEEKTTSTTTQQQSNFFQMVRSENVASFLKSQNDLWREQTMMALHFGKNDSLFDSLIDSFQQQLIATGVEEKNEKDLKSHFLSYARIAVRNDDAFKTAKVERMADATAYGIENKNYSENW